MLLLTAYMDLLLDFILSHVWTQFEKCITSSTSLQKYQVQEKLVGTWYIKVSKYLFLWGVKLYGTVIYILVICKNSDGTGNSPSEAWNWGPVVLLSHLSHLLIYSSIICLFLGHQYLSAMNSLVLFLPWCTVTTGSWFNWIISMTSDSDTTIWSFLSFCLLSHLWKTHYSQ